ncbi:MAG: glycosyltransferase family 4 protein [Acidobacteria bacterium]|nr:glycosyltransferase family 4 protein [Acidobacteriota bacterium]
MRITYFADIRFPLERANGIQTMETCHALAVRGHHVTLAVRPDTRKPARDPYAFYGLPRHERLRIEVAPVSGPAMARRLGYLAFAAGRGMGRGRADVLFTRDLGVASMMLGFPRALRPPVVYESHGYAPDVASALPDLVATATRPSRSKLRRLTSREARVWRDAEGYVTITRGLADELARRHGPRDRIAVVPDGARIRPPGGSSTPDGRATPDRSVKPAPAHDEGGQTSNFAKNGDLTPPPGVVGYAGHLYAWKGVDVLLRALARVPAARGLIVGGHGVEPDLGRLKAQAEELGIAERVTFTGLVEPEQVPAYLERSDVLALPNPESAISTHFTSPLKLFEYMAAGRAIIASDLPAIREVLRHEVHALLVPPGDAEALGAAIERLLGDRVLAGRLAAAAQQTVVDYGWDRRAERLEALFTQVVE